MSDLMSEARARTRADLAYESLYCAAIGGSVIALFFLVIDAVNGQPLFTPSLLGGVLFGGADRRDDHRGAHGLGRATRPSSTSSSFGDASARAWRSSRTRWSCTRDIRPRCCSACSRRSSGSSWWRAMFLLPGVISVLGFWRVAGANLLAAVGHRRVPVGEPSARGVGEASSKPPTVSS